MRNRFHKLWLCVPFVVICLVDASITLHGQDLQYWSGNTSTPNEVFPLFAKALHRSPFVFVAAIAAWIIVFSVAILFLPNLFSEIMALTLVSGHTWGTMTWLVYDAKVRYEVTLVVFVVSSSLFVTCDGAWRRHITETKRQG